MKCPKCGRQIPIHQQYCAFCGVKVEVAFDAIAESMVKEAGLVRTRKIEQALMPVVALGILVNAAIFFYNSLHTETPRAKPSSIPALPPAELSLPKPEPPDPLTVAEPFDRKVWFELSEFKPPPIVMTPEKLEPLRSALMGSRGAGPGVAPAIERGVRFLRSQQAKGEPLGVVNPRGLGTKESYFQVGGTALAALGVLGNGESWLDGESAIEGALTCLVVKVEERTGHAVPATIEVAVNQALAVLAVSRGVLLSGDADLREKAARMVKGLVKLQGESGAWMKPDLRTRKRSPDLWRTAVALLALREAKRAGFEVPPTAFESGRAYAAGTMSRPTGLSGENVPKKLRRGVKIAPFLEPTALAMASRVFAGEGPSPDVLRQLKYVLDNPPSSQSQFGSDHIYAATAALQALYERVPERWMRPAADYLLSKQQSDGSWPCLTKREKRMGIIYPTAFALMTLQCYFGR